MVPIVVFWTNYTATVHGKVFKLVPCEHCNIEYVYVLEREGIGAGTSVYGLNDQAAEANAESGANEALEQYLANDFDPIPCPSCGHYQKFMFPKLMETQSPWPILARIGTLAIVLFSLTNVTLSAFSYFIQPRDHVLERLTISCLIFLISCSIGIALVVADGRRKRNFDPNMIEHQQSRIDKGRLHAITRLEFDKMHPPETRQDQHN